MPYILIVYALIFCAPFLASRTNGVLEGGTPSLREKALSETFPIPDLGLEKDDPRQDACNTNPLNGNPILGASFLGLRSENFSWKSDGTDPSPAEDPFRRREPQSSYAVHGAPGSGSGSGSASRPFPPYYPVFLYCDLPPPRIG